VTGNEEYLIQNDLFVFAAVIIVAALAYYRVPLAALIKKKTKNKNIKVEK
jgi:hypothetical protein